MAPPIKPPITETIVETTPNIKDKTKRATKPTTVPTITPKSPVPTPPTAINPSKERTASTIALAFPARNPAMLPRRRPPAMSPATRPPRKPPAKCPITGNIVPRIIVIRKPTNIPIPVLPKVVTSLIFALKKKVNKRFVLTRPLSAYFGSEKCPKPLGEFL